MSDVKESRKTFYSLSIDARLDNLFIQVLMPPLILVGLAVICLYAKRTVDEMDFYIDVFAVVVLLGAGWLFRLYEPFYFISSFKEDDERIRVVAAYRGSKIKGRLEHASSTGDYVLLRVMNKKDEMQELKVPTTVLGGEASKMVVDTLGSYESSDYSLFGSSLEKIGMKSKGKP